MKKTIITLCMVCFAIGYSFGQKVGELQGDSYIGFNFGTQKASSENLNHISETTSNFVGLNYSYFIKDHKRLNFGVSYSISRNSDNLINSKNKTTGYGLSVGYGRLFPLLKDFYAEVTPSVNYSFRKFSPQQDGSTNQITVSNNDNSYAVNLSGGLLWVPFNHFGISANLASLSLAYTKQRAIETSNNQEYTTTNSSFTFNNQGSLQNQSFSIFYKF